MFDLPRRVSLVEQTAQSIRKAINEGAWREHLPSERRLCEIFKVSRPTIRSALHLLANDGWLDIRQGRRNRLSVQRPAEGAAETRLICLATHLPVEHWSQVVYQAFADIRTRLAADGFVTEVLVCDGPNMRAARQKVEAYLAQNRVFCCVLLSLRYELQRWFAERSVPALVIGSCGPGVRLPSFEVDMRAACRHAVGVFLRHGHRRLAFLVPDTRRGGDLASEQGFLEGVEQASARSGAHGVVIRHGSDPAPLLARLAALFGAAAPPTGVLVGVPQHVHTLNYFLLRRGLRVPEDVSVISRDEDHSFRLMSPAITHYEFEAGAYGSRLTRLMLKLVREGHLAPKRCLIEQKFVPGATVAPRSGAA
jgi:LacI family transcriptional regulator